MAYFKENEKHGYAILAVGELLIDCYNGVKKMGGAPANVVAVVACLGSPSIFLGKIGADEDGLFLLNELNAYGVNTEYVVRDMQASTAVAHVVVDEYGERTFTFQRGADEHLHWSEFEVDDLRAIQLMHFGSATAMVPSEISKIGASRKTYFRLLEWAKGNQIFISFDANYREALWRGNIEEFVQSSKKAISYADFVKVSEEELMLLTGSKNLEEGVSLLHEWGGVVVAVTCGAAGVFLSLGGKSAQIPSVTVEVTDTTGAGDAFVGAVLHGLACDAQAPRVRTFEEWCHLAARANGVAAHVCTHIGALPSPTEVNADSFRKWFLSTP